MQIWNKASLAEVRGRKLEWGEHEESVTDAAVQ